MYRTIFDELYRLNREINRAFGVEGKKHYNQYWPEFNIYENANEYVLSGNVPGIDKKDISISLKDNSVKITGEKKVNYGEGNNYHLRERKSGKFERNFLLNDKVESEKIVAELNNGLLLVKIPKAPETKPFNISIK